MERSAQALGIELPSQESLAEQIMKTLSAAGNPESYCRIIFTRGNGPITLDPTTAENPVLVILVKALEAYPDWNYQKGIRLYIPGVRRNLRAALDPAIKSGNYLNSVLALGEAKREGYDDALMLDLQGRVTEASAANVFLVKDRVLRTPPLETGILEGVTRGFVLAITREAGITCQECDLRVEDLEAANEVMLTSTLREIMPVTQIGEVKIGRGVPGPITAKLRELFRAFVERRQGHRS
jgi:branched-chain amino acid aminotransferase